MRLSRRYGFVAASGLLLSAGLVAGQDDEPASRGERHAGRKAGAVGTADSNPALNEPDKFAWELFARIDKPADNGTNDTVWETWATDQETFPNEPDPSDPPKWPGGSARKKALVPSNQQLIRRHSILRESPHNAFLRERGRTPRAPLPEITAGGGEEVRRNQPDFDYIMANKLYYVQGLEAAFTKGAPISFPVASIEIKARWKPITDDEKPRYHWNVDSSGKLFGLIALHIMSKDIPNWFWATWEQVDNPDRCKVLGCHDTFGLTPQGTVSPALLALFKQYGLGKEWTNYRLDGAQTDFTDSVGRPTLLGNSITEAGFVATSSCITCHGRSTFNATNQSLSIFTPDGQSYNGTPDPHWYYTASPNPTMIYLQADFVWSFLNANPASTGASR